MKWKNRLWLSVLVSVQCMSKVNCSAIGAGRSTSLGKIYFHPPANCLHSAFIVTQVFRLVSHNDTIIVPDLFI